MEKPHIEMGSLGRASFDGKAQESGYRSLDRNSHKHSGDSIKWEVGFMRMKEFTISEGERRTKIKTKRKQSSKRDKGKEERGMRARQERRASLTAPAPQTCLKTYLSSRSDWHQQGQFQESNKEAV